MPQAVLGLGGNLGARRAIFRAAIALLDAEPACRVLARSQLYATPPLGPPQPDYLNAAVRVQFEGDVDALFALAQRIEATLGRERRERWGARTIDIDLLHWSEGPVRTVHVEVPHRELKGRAFALAPLLDAAPELTESLGRTLATLGGPPRLAAPGWSDPTHEGDSLCWAWLHEDAELASQWIEALVASERTRFEGLPAKQPLASHTFMGPAELFDADGRSWLTAVVADAFARGFAVQRGAVLARDETQASGVLLGFDAKAAVLGPPRAVLESDETGARRVKMPQSVSERGFARKSSGTM